MSGSRNIRGFFMNLLTSGIKDRLEPEEQIKLLFINSIMIVGVAVLAFFGIRDLVEGQLFLGIVTLIIPMAVAALFWSIRVTKNVMIGAWVLPFLMFAFYTYLTASGGTHSSGVLWMVTYPLISIFLLGSFRGGIFAGVFLVTQMCVLFVPGLTEAVGLDLEFKARLAGAYTIITAFSLAFEIIRLRAQQEIERGRKELAKKTSELLTAKAQTDGIMANVREGIFLIDHNLKIEEQYSESLESLLGKPALAGAEFCSTLQGRMDEKELSSVKDYLEMFFQPSPPWELLFEINPLSAISLGSSDQGLKRLEFAFAPVELDDGRRVLGTIRDVTESYELGLKLKEEEDRSARQMRHLFQIIHVKPELLIQFLQDAEEEMSDINRQLKEPTESQSDLLESIYQGVHAIKGNAALVGLSSFSQKVHELEDRISPLRQAVPEWKDLLEITVELAKIQAELQEIKDLIERTATFQKDLEATTESQNDLILMTLSRALERLATETQKLAHLDVKNFNPSHVRPGQRKVLKDVLVQMLRNSFSHGLESVEERKERGKRHEGKIRVATKLERDKLILTYQDDGRGLQVDRIREKAKSHPLFPSLNVDDLNDAKVVSLIFYPGFSTAEGSNIHSGRGVGMSLIKKRIEAHGGFLRIRSSPGKGLAFDIELPLA